MAVNRRTAFIVGILFIIGTVSGILSGMFTEPVLSGQAVLADLSANSNQILIGVLCVLAMGFSLAMVPVMLFPIFKKYNEALAIGSVVFRGALETVGYILMATSWLLLLTLGEAYITAGVTDTSHFQTIGTLLISVNHQINPILELTFSIGALMVYSLFFQSRLIPRWLSGWGLLGACVYFVAGLLALFGLELDYLLYILALQEMVLALWLIFRGFSSSAISPKVAS
jgi:hypothetical protein